MHRLLKPAAAFLLAVSFSLAVYTQDTVKKVVVNPDGSYSVIEYPTNKEVVVTLLPSDGVSSTGTARVMRTAAGTKVFFDVAGCLLYTSDAADE